MIWQVTIKTVRGEMETESFVVEMMVTTKLSVTGGGKRNPEVVTGEMIMTVIECQTETGTAIVTEMIGEKVEVAIGSATVIDPGALMTAVAMTTEAMAVLKTEADTETMIVIVVVGTTSTEVAMTEIEIETNMEVGHLVLAFEIKTVIDQTDMVLRETDMSGMVTDMEAGIPTENGRETVETDIVRMKIDTVTTAADTRAMTGTETAATVTVTPVIGTETVVNGWVMKTGHASVLMVETETKTSLTTDITLPPEAEIRLENVIHL